MKKLLITLISGASILAVGLAVGFASPAGLAGAALQADESTTDDVEPGEDGDAQPERRRGPGQIVDGVLDGAVADSVIDQAQADDLDVRFDEAFEEARSDRRARHRRHHIRHAAVQTAAETIGIEATDLRDAVREGQSVADVAEANGTDPEAVVHAIVTAAHERIDQALANGRIDETQAANAKEKAAEAAERFVYETGQRPSDVPADGAETEEA